MYTPMVIGPDSSPLATERVFCSLLGANQERSEEDCKLEGGRRVQKFGTKIACSDAIVDPVDLFRRVEEFNGLSCTNSL